MTGKGNAMGYLRMSVIGVLWLGFTVPLQAVPQTDGVIREVKHGTQQIRIDERLYKPTRDLRD